MSARTADSGICCEGLELLPEGEEESGAAAAALAAEEEVEEEACIAARIFSALSARLLVDVNSRRRDSTSRKLVESISASWALDWPVVAVVVVVVGVAAVNVVVVGDMIVVMGGERALLRGETDGAAGCGDVDIRLGGGGRDYRQMKKMKGAVVMAARR